MSIFDLEDAIKYLRKFAAALDDNEEVVLTVKQPGKSEQDLFITKQSEIVNIKSVKTIEAK